MGFARTASTTTLGQRLDFAADVALDSDETLERRCVKAEVSIGDAKVAPDNLRVTLENGRADGERRVRVTSRVAVDEPVVSVEVTVGCASQMSRRFVVFVDPPALRLAQTEVEPPLAPQRVETQVAPLLDIVRGADASRRRALPERGRHDDDASSRPRTARVPSPGRRLAAAQGVQTVASGATPRPLAIRHGSHALRPPRWRARMDRG